MIGSTKGAFRDVSTVKYYRRLNNAQLDAMASSEQAGPAGMAKREIARRERRRQKKAEKSRGKAEMAKSARKE